MRERINPVTAPLTALRAPPPLWREARLGLEAARLLRSEVFRGEGVPHGGGRPVLLIPGFLAGDDSLGLMTRWLRRSGYHTRKAGIRLNVGCSSEGVARLERRLEELVERQGRKAAVVGQSRGGTFARVLARRRPDLVAGVVTLGTPHVDPLAVHPLVGLQLLAVGALGTLGAPGLFRRSCLRGDCCAGFWAACSTELPRAVRFTSIYSRSDGIVDWRACLAPGARQVEVRASHIGMAVSAEAYAAVAQALGELGAARRRGPRATLPKAA